MPLEGLGAEALFGCGILSIHRRRMEGPSEWEGIMQGNTRQRALRVFGVAAITVGMIHYSPSALAAGGSGNSPQVTQRFQDTSGGSTGANGGDATSGGATGGNGGD